MSNRNSATCVPVFSVENCVNPSATSGQSYGFSSFVTAANTEHGDFDLPSGIFTVKTPGNFQLNFYSYSYLAVLSASNISHRVELKVNDKVAAVSLNQSSVETGGFHNTVISALLPLRTGDKIGVFASAGKLYQEAS